MYTPSNYDKELLHSPRTMTSPMALEIHGLFNPPALLEVTMHNNVVLKKTAPLCYGL